MDARRFGVPGEQLGEIHIEDLAERRVQQVRYVRGVGSPVAGVARGIKPAITCDKPAKSAASISSTSSTGRFVTAAVSAMLAAKSPSAARTFSTAAISRTFGRRRSMIDTPFPLTFKGY